MYIVRASNGTVREIKEPYRNLVKFGKCIEEARSKVREDLLDSALEIARYVKKMHQIVNRGHRIIPVPSEDVAQLFFSAGCPPESLGADLLGAFDKVGSFLGSHGIFLKVLLEDGELHYIVGRAIQNPFSMNGHSPILVDIVEATFEVQTGIHFPDNSSAVFLNFLFTEHSRVGRILSLLDSEGGGPELQRQIKKAIKLASKDSISTQEVVAFAKEFGSESEVEHSRAITILADVRYFVLGLKKKGFSLTLHTEEELRASLPYLARTNLASVIAHEWFHSSDLAFHNSKNREIDHVIFERNGVLAKILYSECPELEFSEVFGVLLFGIPESEMGRNTVLGYKSCMEEIKDGVMGNPPDSSKIPEFFGMDGERLGYFALLAAVKYYLYEFGETPDFIVHCGQIARKLELASQEIIPAVQR